MTELIKKELKGLPTLSPDTVVTIWKLNYGFRTDLQNYTVDYHTDSLGKNQRKVSVGKAQVFWNVLGIYEAPTLGISKISNLALGLTDEEVQQRLSVIRQLPQELAQSIYVEIVNFNNTDDEKEEDKEEIIKK